MDNNNSKITINNRMTASQFVRQNGGELDFIRNPHTGRVFFACGTKKGYVSKKLLEKLDTVSLQDVTYGEIPYVDKDGKSQVAPTLFLASTANVVKSFKL